MKGFRRYALVVGIFGAVIGLAAPSIGSAAGRTAIHGSSEMSPMRPLNDDKCDAKCDEDSDKCMTQAGKDAGKQRQCDVAYDDCLRKCQTG